MKSLLFLLAIGLASSDKLDRTYLPPPGSKFAGGSPGAIDVPLEYPKQPYSTTLPPLLPGDFQATVGIDRGIQDQDILGPPPSNYGQKLPTTTTSYAFTQTTTFPPAEGFETTIIPGQEYPGDGSFGDQQAGLGNYPQNYDQQLNVQGPAFGQPGQTVSQTGLLPTQGTTIHPGFPSQFGQGFDRRPGYKQPPNLGQYQQTFRPSSTISPINNISQTPGFVPQAPYGQNQGSNQYLGVQPPQESFGQEGSYRPGIATQYGDDTNNVQETFPGNNIPQQLGAQGQSQFIGQQVPSTTARPQGIPPNYQPGLRPQYGNNIVQGIRGPGSNIGQQLEGQKPYGQPGLLPTTGAPVIPGYQPGSSTQFGPAGSGIDGTQQFGNQRPIPGQAGSLPSTVSPQGIPGYRPGTSDQYGQKVSPGITRPGTTTQQVSSQRPGQTQQGISPTTLGPQVIYQPSSTPQYGENISQGTTIPGIGQQLGGQRPGIDQQGIVLPSSSPQGYQPGTSQYSGDLDNIRGIPGSSLPGQQTQPQINQNQYQATSGGQRPTQQYPSSVKPDGNAFRGDGQTIYRPDGTVATSVLPPGYNQPTFPSTTPSSFSSYGTTGPGNVSPTTPGYNQGTVFPTGSQRLQRPQADADRNAVILNYENVLTPEGFSYSFDTSNGIHADESGTAVGGVKAQGSYSYTGDDGKFYEVIYSADENGFQPRGDHLPTPPPIPEAIKKVIEQAAKDKAAGILHDGSYDEYKYGHKKYQGMMLRYRPKIQKESIANGADIPDEYDSQFIRDNKKKLGQPGATTDDITDETEYDEFSGDEDLQANMEKLRGDGRRPSSGIPGRFPSNAPSKDTYENFNGERITQNINQQPKGPISGTRKEYPTGNEEFSTPRPTIPGHKGNRPYSSKDMNDGFQDYEILDKNYDYGSPGQGYNTDTRLPSRPSETPEEKEVRLLQKKPTVTIQQTDRPGGPKRLIGSGSKYRDQTYDTELMNDSDYNTRPSQQKRPNKVFNNQNVGSEDDSEDYYQPDGEQTVTKRPIGSKRPGISGSRYNENQNLRSQTRKPGQSRQPGQSRRPDESIQTNAAGQFDRPRQPGELRQPGKPNQPDTYMQGGDYRRPGEPSLTSSQEVFSGIRGETPNDITLEQNKVNRPGYNEQVNTEDKYSSQRPTESSGYQYIPPQNKFELDRNKYPVGFTDMKDISSTRRPTTQYNISKGTTPRPFITPNVFEDEDRTSVTRKPGKVTSSPITTQNDHGTTDYLEYDDKDLDQEIGDDTITSTTRPGQSGITTIGSTRRPYSQTQQTTSIPQYNKEYLPGGQKPRPGSKGDYTEEYESESEGTLIPGDVNYNVQTPTSKTPGYIYTSTTPLPSRYPEQYGTRRPGLNQQPTTQYTTFRPTSGPYDDESTTITKRPVTNTGVTSGRPVYSDRTNTFPSSTTIRPTTPGTYNGLGDDYDRITAPGSVTVRPSSRLPAGRPGRPGRPMSDYSDRTSKPGSVTLRPGTVGTSQITGRPTQEPADYADYNQSGQPSGVSGRPVYSDETSTAITVRPGTNRNPGSSGAAGNLPSTTYRPSLYTERTQTKPSVTVDAYGRPITELPDGRIPTTTFRPESSPRLPVQVDYQIDQNPSQIDNNQGVPYQSNVSHFGSQEFAPGQLPYEGQVETGGSYGPYPSSTTTERIIGEDFSGPKQAQKFDPETGYYY